jgi:putative peptidoglycan lipid II flippase
MGNDTQRRLAYAAAFLVIATASSRVLGLVREVVMVGYLGMGPQMGAFTVAQKVPNLVRTLLADTALSAAFIPVFSGLLEKGRRRDAWQVAFTVTLFATVLLGVVTALGMVFAPGVIRLVAPSWSNDYPELIPWTVSLMRVMFPTVVILGIAGIFMGILNSHNHFTMPALAPIVWNVIIIGVTVAFANGYGFAALAWGFLLGTVAELLLQVPSVVKRRWRRGDEAAVGEAADDVGVPVGGGPAGGFVYEEPSSPWRIAWRSPEVRKVGALLGPVILSLGIVNFNSFIGTIVATLISAEAPAYIDKAFRLFQLPQGMFAIAIGTVLFPALSRHGAAGRMGEFRQDLSLGIRQIFFVTLPFVAFFSVLSVPTIRLIYEHGATRGDEAAVAGMAASLLFFSVGMAFVSVNTLLNRAFYSLQKAWVPLVMGAINLAVNAGLMMLLYKPMGVAGVTLATSVVSIINFFGLMALLSPRVGGIDVKQIAWSAGRAVVALVPLATIAYGVWWGLDSLLGRRVWAQIVAVGLAYLLGGLAYCAAAWVMRVPELREMVGLLKRRRKAQPVVEGE